MKLDGTLARTKKHLKQLEFVVLHLHKLFVVFSGLAVVNVVAEEVQDGECGLS
jgi:hypothetical protein